jgi:hypothetical protein
MNYKHSSLQYTQSRTEFFSWATGSDSSLHVLVLKNLDQSYTYLLKLNITKRYAEEIILRS